ncbi:MAG TPA: FKBP-type peptidyl-prolyl cis-trans isomerase [Verrucomicrobiae bacterium]
MKLIQTAFVAAGLVALNASAQPPQQQPRPSVPPALTGPPRTIPNRPPPEPAAPTPMPSADKLSYAIGMSIANNIKHDQLDLDIDTLAIAMKDVLGNKPTRITEAELKDTMMQFQKAMPTWVADKNKAAGEAYLAKNGKVPGVTTLPDGLEYKVMKEGAGPKPLPTDSVVVNYKGSLTDGTVFDQRDGFKTKVTGQTIPGWTAILPLMNTGSKWEVTIPSAMAYGMRGPRSIGPNSVLIFEMELVSIAPPEPAAPPKASNAPPISPVFRPSASGTPPIPPGVGATPVVSGQIIKVPSAEELKKGAKIEVITNAPSGS